MAFTPNIDYVGHQRLRQRGLEGVTQAKLQTKLRAEAEARRQAAIAASKKKKSSMGRKIVGAVARGAAAYYTGGASEASGVGAMIDQQIQGGKDYERNEYGDIVGAASTMSGMMTAKRTNDASTRLNAQSAKDDAMQERMDKISPEAGLDFAQKREAKDAKNRKVFDEYKDGFLNFGKDVDGLDLSATVIDYSGIKKQDKITTTPAQIEGQDYSQSDDIEAQDFSKPIEQSAEMKALYEDDYKGKPVSWRNTDEKFMPPKAAPVTVPVEQPESEIITEDSHNTQGVLGAR